MTVLLGGLELGASNRAVDTATASFCVDVVGIFFSVALSEGVFVRASAGRVRATASDFFMVSGPFSVVPFGSVI